MANIELSTRINAPPERVFEVFTDLPNAAENIRGVERIEVLTDGPIGKGTRWRETRTMMKRECTETLEFAEFQPPKAFTVVCDSHGSVWTSRFRIVPDGDSARVELSMSCRAVSFGAKLMSPLSSLFAGAIRKAMEQDFEDMRRVAEGEAAPA